MCTTRQVNLSDHRLFRAKISLRSVCRGPGYFKLNTLLLEDEGVSDYFENFLRVLIPLEHGIFQEWEHFKSFTKTFFIKLGKLRSKDRNLRRKCLEDRIRNALDLLNTGNDNGNIKNYLKRLKHELELLNSFYIASCRLNTYYSDFVNDRASLSTVKSLQRKSWEQRHIFSIMDPQGNLVEDPGEVLNEFETQFRRLFESQRIDVDLLNFFLSQEGLRRLDEAQKIILDEHITVDEVKKAIYSFQRNKTPGLDGIPIDFYLKYSNSVSIVLCRLYNYYLELSELNDSAYDGVITLIFKGKGERFLRENWRPITLLNLDYKIFTKILARRLEKVMSTLVHPDQTSSVPGRNISDSLAHVFCIVNHAKEHNAQALILSVDHQSAFDVVEWEFIFRTLTAMNFGPRFLAWLKCIYKENYTRSRVMVNGVLSDTFKVFRGVRQGCPISPLLYVITSEVFAHYIRITNRISGIPLYGCNNRITKYADDTSLFLSSWEEVATVFEIFGWYEKASGSKIKVAKTQILLLGDMQRQAVPNAFLNYVTEKIKLYGIWITSDGFESPENWVKCTETIQRLQTRIPPFGISIFAKMHFIYTYYLCMFSYVLKVTSPPNALVQNIYKTIRTFLWYPSRACVIKQDTLRNPARLGGIGFPDIIIRKQVNRLCLFIRVLSFKEILSWRRAFNHFYAEVENVPKRSLKNSTAAIIFREIRAAVIDAGFRRDGEFCWLFRKRFVMCNVTPKVIYDLWIESKYGPESITFNSKWIGDLGVSHLYAKKSWIWAKAKFADGKARDVHYKIRHKALYTNHRTQHFTESDGLCSYCKLFDVDVREDNTHILIYCIRTYTFIGEISPLLQRVSKRNHISLADLVLGTNLSNKYDETCFNWIIQNLHYAIWRARCLLEFEDKNTPVRDIFEKQIFRSLCRLKTYLTPEMFYNYFHELTIANSSVIGFQLRELSSYYE